MPFLSDIGEALDTFGDLIAAGEDAGVKFQEARAKWEAGLREFSSPRMQALRFLIEAVEDRFSAESNNTSQDDDSLQLADWWRRADMALWGCLTGAGDGGWEGDTRRLLKAAAILQSAIESRVRSRHAAMIAGAKDQVHEIAERTAATISTGRPV